MTLLQLKGGRAPYTLLKQLQKGKLTLTKEALRRTVNSLKGVSTKEKKGLPGLEEILASAECTTNEESSVSETSEEKRRSTAEPGDGDHRRSHKKRRCPKSTSNADHQKKK